MQKSISNSNVNIINCNNGNVGVHIFQSLNIPKTINPDNNTLQKELPPEQPCSSSSSKTSSKTSSYTSSEPSNSQRNQKVSSSQECSAQIQPNQINQNRWKNYSNISQIRHKGIYQLNKNTFHISTGCCFKSFPIIFFSVGLIVIILPAATAKMGYYFIATSIFGLIFLCAGIYLFFRMYNNIYFIMGQNTLTVIKKAMCRKVKTIYNPGELKKIEFNHDYSLSHDSDGSSYIHKYNLVVVQTNGDVDNIFSLGSSNSIFTLEEIDYFLSFINDHIQTKMKA